MIQEIIKYPTPPSIEYGTDVRIFNEEIFTLLDDLKDTIIENNLEALAAFQIGNYYNIVVIKEKDGTFLELINPRLISAKDKITTTETTAYFPNLSAEIQRHDSISIIYQDRAGSMHSLMASGDKSVLLQRKLDYNFGATFLSKLSKKEKAKFEKKLEFGSDFAISESCPTTFKRDYLVKLSNILLVSMVLLIVVSFFISNQEMHSSMWKTQLFISVTTLLTNIAYFFYAHYEAKQYTSCVSCQSGNIIGTTLVALIKIAVLTVASYFIM
ncbi:MAG: peptide deformylase [Campylobacterales bacterium]|nr:peptide deformylase [Campylobacterales bacterium]